MMSSKSNCCATPENAVKKGHSECLECLFLRGHDVTLTDMLTAVGNNNRLLIHIFVEYEITPDARVTLVAAKTNTELLKYFINLGYPWDPNATAAVAKRGDPEFAISLIEKGLPYNSREVQLCTSVKTLLYLGSKGIPLEPEIGVFAAGYGVTPLLTHYLRNGGDLAPVIWKAFGSVRVVNLIRSIHDSGIPDTILQQAIPGILTPDDIHECIQELDDLIDFRRGFAGHDFTDQDVESYLKIAKKIVRLFSNTLDMDSFNDLLQKIIKYNA